MDGVVFEPQFCTHNGTFCKQAHNDYHYFPFKLTSSQSRPGHTVVKSIHSFGAAPIHWCWRDVKVCMFASLTLQTFFDPYKNRKKLRELFAVTQSGYLHYYTSVLYTVYTMYFLAYFLPLRNQNCDHRVREINTQFFDCYECTGYSQYTECNSQCEHTYIHQIASVSMKVRELRHSDTD